MMISTTSLQPFDLADDTAYRCWREWKLDHYPASAAELIVTVGNPGRLEEAERCMILKALKATGGNRTRAARHLGISRRTLHRKLNQYGLRETP